VRTRIKICGITSAADARLAVDAGADAIGMIFYAPAPRNISLETAKAILDVLPAFVTPVGVFGDADNATVSKTVDALHLRHVQLNGGQTPAQVAELRGLRVIKAIRVDATFRDELAKWRAAELKNLIGIVLETGGTKEAGGTGIANDWAAIHCCQDEGGFIGLPPIIAAGGLMPGTVANIVREIRPFAVDVSSGVESERGKKSAEKIADFIRAVRGEDEL
jgi:phosphoribosylanthranilate isomerase